MKISRSITEQFAPDLAVTGDDDVEAGMPAKLKEFAEAGHRGFLPTAD